MDRQSAALVVTTIFDAKVLDEYYANFSRFGHLDQVRGFVIPDRKTPPELYERCRRLNQSGFHLECPTLEEQELFLRRVGLPPELVPFNSDNRRNVGYLMALESGLDFTISIDDDNYCTSEEDVFAEHAVVTGSAHGIEAVESETGFFNICDLMEMERPAPVYARGFPYFARHQRENPRVSVSFGPVHINAGLWTLDPDIDGITWLVAAPRVKSFRGRSVMLGTGTWSPINTQNTALRGDVLPAYYFVKMGYPMGGIAIDRYGDIFSGYFAEACAKHLHGGIRAGTPVAEHRRNSHNYMKDAVNELACVALLEDLLPWLREEKLSGGNYTETYESLSHALEGAVERFSGMLWNDSTRGYFHQTAWHMRAWLRACRTIQGAAGYRPKAAAA